MDNIITDLTIIGAGPGGYVAAIRAAQLNMKVCIIEKNLVGGTCLNRGCISSKSLISSAQKLHAIKSAEEHGIYVNSYSFDVKKMVERKNKIVSILREGIISLFKKHKINLIQGTAKFLSQNKILIASNSGSETVIETQKTIIATGSEPLIIPQFNIDKEKILTSNEALNLDKLPQKMLIIGAGVLGSEFAGLFNGLGVDVTLIEACDRLFPLIDIDIDIIKHITNIFKRTGIKLKFGKKVSKISRRKKTDTQNSNDEEVVAILEDGEEISADIAVVSIGRSLNSSGLGLEEVGISTGRYGEIAVDEKMRTVNENIYAIGDITNIMQLAHVASRQGVVAVESMLGHQSQIDYQKIPWVIYTFPNIAVVGLSEKKAIECGYEIKCGTFNYRALGKARAAGEIEGLIKLVCDKKTDKVLGGHLIGSGSPEIIHEVLLAIETGITATEFRNIVHAHPSFSEGLFESFENVHGLGIHS